MINFSQYKMIVIVIQVTIMKIVVWKAKVNKILKKLIKLVINREINCSKKNKNIY
jgi:hypothetical protein